MKRIILSLCLASLIALFPASTVKADIITADFTVSIISVQVVRNTVDSTGDMAILFHYDLHTDDPLPDDTATVSFIFRLYDTDGTTLLATTNPFAYRYLNYGYQEGASSFYFTGAEMTALGLAWYDALKIDIVGSPAYFTTLPDPYTYTLKASDYCDSTDQTDNQNAAADYILAMCDPLEDSTTDDITLKASTDTGTVLTATGEYYFRGAILGIQSIAPTLFYTQYYVPESTDLGYTMDQADVYAARLAGTDIETGINNTGALLGMSGDNFIAAVFIVICLAIILFLAYKGWGVEPGLLVSGIVITSGGLTFGNQLFYMTLIMTLLGGIFIFFALWLKRA